MIYFQLGMQNKKHKLRELFNDNGDTRMMNEIYKW